MTALVTADCAADGTRPPDALIQRLEPRVRVVSAAAFALVAVSLGSLPLLVAMSGLAAGLAALARLPIGRTLWRLAGLEAFMVPVLVFLPFTVAGTPIFHLGPFPATAEGVYQAARIVLTANAVVLSTLALVGTIEPATLGHALLGLGVPEKLARMMLLTVRYVAVLREEQNRLRVAMRARAFRPAGDAHTWRTYGYLFGMLLVRSFERSERILEAMKCRGFAGRWMVADASPPGAIDWAFVAAMFTVLLAIAGCGAMGLVGG